MDSNLLSANERTRIIKSTVYESDITQATANTAQTLDLFPILAGQIVVRVWFKLRVPFKNSADAAFNTTTMSLGDTSGVAALLAAQETNENGTEILCAVSSTAKAYPAADTARVTFNSMAAKSLVNLDTGIVDIFHEILDLPKL